MTGLEPISLSAMVPFPDLSSCILLPRLSGALATEGGEGQAEGNLTQARGLVKAKLDRASFQARPGEGVGVAGLCGQCSPESSHGFPPATLTAFLPERGPERALAGLGVSHRGRWYSGHKACPLDGCCRVCSLCQVPFNQVFPSSSRCWGLRPPITPEGDGLPSSQGDYPDRRRGCFKITQNRVLTPAGFLHLHHRNKNAEPFVPFSS